MLPGNNRDGSRGTDKSDTTRRSVLRAAGVTAAIGLSGTANASEITDARSGLEAGPVSGSCSGYWTKFDGSDRYMPFYPDQKVAYWLYEFEIEADSTVGLRFSGAFPESRYMSFTAYTMNDRDISGAIRDEHIEPSSGKNPFRWGNRGRGGVSKDGSPDVPGDGAEGTYAVAAVPHESARLDESNTFALPETDSSKQFVAILYRVYLPDKGADDTGGVGLPRIEAFDDETGERVRCPAPVEPTVSPQLGSTGGDGGQRSANPPNPVWLDKELSFIHVRGNGYFGNDDTKYLAALTNRAYGSLVAHRWRAPTHAETYDTEPGNYEGEVRYWSMSIGDLSDTTTNNTVADYECELTEGFVHLLCGPEALRPRYEDVDGLTYLSWNGARNPLFIYRNQIARSTFEGRFGNCEIPPKEIEEGEIRGTPVLSSDAYDARQYIDEYAPTARHYRVTEFDPESFVRGED